MPPVVVVTRASAVAAPDIRDAGGTPPELPTDVADVAFSSVFARFTDVEPEECRRVTEVTYLGFGHGTMAAFERMIVQVGSALAYRGIPLQSAYCGAKNTIQGFNEALRRELPHERSGIHLLRRTVQSITDSRFRRAAKKVWQ